MSDPSPFLDKYWCPSLTPNNVNARVIRFHLFLFFEIKQWSFVCTDPWNDGNPGENPAHCVMLTWKPTDFLGHMMCRPHDDRIPIPLWNWDMVLIQPRCSNPGPGSKQVGHPNNVLSDIFNLILTVIIFRPVRPNPQYRPHKVTENTETTRLRIVLFYLDTYVYFLSMFSSVGL